MKFWLSTSVPEKLTLPVQLYLWLGDKLFTTSEEPLNFIGSGKPVDTKRILSIF